MCIGSPLERKDREDLEAGGSFGPVDRQARLGGPVIREGQNQTPLPYSVSK